MQLNALKAACFKLSKLCTHGPRGLATSPAVRKLLAHVQRHEDAARKLAQQVSEGMLLLCSWEGDQAVAALIDSVSALHTELAGLPADMGDRTILSWTKRLGIVLHQLRSTFPADSSAGRQQQSASGSSGAAALPADPSVVHEPQAGAQRTLDGFVLSTDSMPLAKVLR